jgi:hypothetical protein
VDGLNEYGKSISVLIEQYIAVVLMHVTDILLQSWNTLILIKVHCCIGRISSISVIIIIIITLDV